MDVINAIYLVIVFKFQTCITIFILIIHLGKILCIQVVLIKEIGELLACFFIK